MTEQGVYRESYQHHDIEVRKNVDGIWPLLWVAKIYRKGQYCDSIDTVTERRAIKLAVRRVDRRIKRARSVADLDD